MPTHSSIIKDPTSEQTIEDADLDLFLKSPESPEGIRSRKEKEEPIYDNVSIDSEYKAPVVWKNIILFVFLHSSLFYCLHALIFDWPWRTLLFSIFLGILSGVGVTVGAHRLWSHRSYKARFPFRVFLATLQTLAGQNDIYEWCRDHRVHHKFAETDADPHNSKRGFLFAHMGWLCVKKHPQVIEKGKSVDLSDLLRDPVVRFQRRFYIPLCFLISFIIPSMIPVYGWSEKGMTAFMMAGLARYCVSLHVTWLVNSAAHYWGSQPYDRSINARENKYVAYISIGEGFHNYHHTFPWDYASSELGYKLNLSKRIIDMMAYFGQAYDLKTVSKEMILKRRMRTGDLSKHELEEEHALGQETPE